MSEPFLIAGVDEVGRGPLAGPVVTAAVILHDQDPLLGQYRDSKKLSEKKRLMMYHHIRRHAVSYAVALASVDEIDRMNILHATMLAMRRCVERLHIRPEKVLVDGNRLPSLYVPAESVIGGDDRVQQIAAASIVAKVIRDRMMHQIAVKYPVYGFSAHKGYGTKVHLEALREHGPCPWHRKSFSPVQRASRNLL